MLTKVHVCPACGVALLAFLSDNSSLLPLGGKDKTVHSSPLMWLLHLWSSLLGTFPLINLLSLSLNDSLLSSLLHKTKDPHTLGREPLTTCFPAIVRHLNFGIQFIRNPSSIMDSICFPVCLTHCWRDMGYWALLLRWPSQRWEPYEYDWTKMWVHIIWA